MKSKQSTAIMPNASDFVRYYRSGLTHMDSMYYLRGSIDTALYLESFHHERDPSFSTNCNFKVARILANELLIQYLTKELEVFEQRQVETVSPSCPTNLERYENGTGRADLCVGQP